MIEIREIEGSKPKEFRLFIDGSFVDAKVGPGSAVTVSNPAVVELLMAKPVSETTSINLWVLSFPGILDWWEGKGLKFITISCSQKMNSYDLSIIVQASLLDWRRLWTISEYKQEIESLLKLEPYKDIIKIENEHFELSEMGLIQVVFYVNEQQTIGAEIVRCSDILYEVHNEAEKRLTAKLRTDSVIMYFDFPIEVRSSCEQYLLYFIEFLRDLGVEADAELKHDISGVLFAVTPTNSTDALDKIRLALEVFLSLPSGSINDSSIMLEAVEIQRLSANIHHLRGQLSLAAAVMKAKDATIEAQQITIQQQRLLLNGEVVLDSMKAINTPVKEENREEVLKDILAVTEYKGKGFELNLPEIIRRLKRLFSDK